MMCRCYDDLARNVVRLSATDLYGPNYDADKGMFHVVFFGRSADADLCRSAAGDIFFTEGGRRSPACRNLTSVQPAQA